MGSDFGIANKPIRRKKLPRLGGNAAATLLVASWIALASVPAIADGGNGGPSNGIPGGVGGTGFNGAPGADATVNTTAGAGGGGAGGGNGGNGKFIIGSGGSGGGGGLGGTLGSPNGQDAGPGANGGGGGGGGGGYHGNGAGASSIANTATLTGGNGGNAGGGSAGGGGGGAGGYGAIVTGAVASSNSGTITPGAGGIGGLASSIFDRGGNGGDGGVGVQFTASGSTFANSGTVSGGNGGASGGSNRGAEGMGGVGIVGANLTIVNSGTISGGLSGDTLTRANAVTFTGGVNILELRAGSSFVGNVVAASTADTLRLGGSTSANFNLFTIGDTGQYRGFGKFEKTGISTWTLTGISNGAWQWTVNGGTLLVNGQMFSNAFTVNSGAILGGTGTVGTLVVNSGGTLAPGDVTSIFQVNGNYTQGAESFYQVAVNAAGQNSRLSVSSTATLNGGTVQVVAASGTYSPTTTYTIVNATGGVSGTFSNVSSNFAFLTPSLSYDANNAYLTLTTNFAQNSPNPTQTTVGTTLNGIGAFATGDMLTVLGAIAVLNPTQAEYAIRSISGQNLSSFSTTMVQTAQMFMNNLASQAGSAGGGNRVMMAEACDVACDTTDPAQWGAWGGAVGGLGTIGAGQSVGAVTYNAGGFAAGLDRRFGPSFLAGVTVGFTTGTQWVGGFDGKGTSSTFQAGLYGSFTQDRFYLDGLVGYGYASNQSWRNILIPGLQPRTAMGQTGANQFFGQLETGYRVDLGGTAAAYVTPFARLQGYTATQNAYTETGAQSLNLNVAAATTNSLRSVLGAVLGANMNVGWRSPIAGQLRLGWSHEYGNVDRPITTSFTQVPSLPFTTFGVTPQRDGVLFGLSANTDVADATSLYLKYEGTISGQDSAHAMTVGVRIIW